MDKTLTIINQIKKQNLLLAIALIISLACQTQSYALSPQPPELSILCIGDSITQGGRQAEEYTYRYPLYQLLKSKHYKVNLIGSKKNGLDGNFTWPEHMDLDHEGYYGQKTVYVERAVIKNLGTLEKPDIAIIHLGTNDKVISEDTITKPYKRIINALRAKNPRIKILLVQIPGWKNLKLHFLVWKAAMELGSNESPVRTIPLYKFWDNSKYTFDGVHPNQVGQQKMANIFYEYITSN
ncbi:MAG TPA: GDSL-type esterase/lipase family protein [Methylophilus sp.]